MEQDNSINDDPWQIREEAYDRLKSPADRACFLLNYAVLAPSRLNTQPWLFSVTSREISLYADRRRGLAVADPDDRELTMACGAALDHLKVAMPSRSF